MKGIQDKVNKKAKIKECKGGKKGRRKKLNGGNKINKPKKD